MINKQTFNMMQDTANGGNIYEMVYSLNKKLKDDQRLIYYSFHTVLLYKELLPLLVFTIANTASVGITITLAQANASDLVWPFEYYCIGGGCGLLVVIFISDFLF